MAVKIKILSGPHKGKEREILDGEHEGVKIPPMKLLTQLFQLGSCWELDLSDADEHEVLEWGRADIGARLVRALVEGRSVFFLGEEYRATTSADIPRIGQEVEDLVVASAYYVRVESDDEAGLVIGTTNRRERPLN